MTLQALTTLLVAAAAIPAHIFPILYAVWAPWHTSREGRHMMGFTTVIALFLDLVLFVRLVGPQPWVRQVALVLYTAVTVMLWQQLFLLISAHRAPRP